MPVSWAKLYLLEICLLYKVFHLTRRENQEIEKLSVYIAVFNGYAFIGSFLSASAGVNDLEY